MNQPDQILRTECPLNHQCSWEFLYKTAFAGHDLPVYHCGKCGLEAIHPAARKSTSELYNESYYAGSQDFSYKDERKQFRFEKYVWDARIKNIRKYVRTGNFLDIGSSFGGLLQSAQQAGFSPYGIEISGYAAAYANAAGIPTFNGSLTESRFDDGFFNVVTMIEVIEHLPEPDKIFDRLSRLLAPGGLLVIQTANFSGWQAVKAGSQYHYYLPGHFYYYNADNLVKILEQRGFNRFRIYHGVDFGLVPKLLKSQGTFRGVTDYFKWFKISWYHFKSSLFYKKRPLTSSMVVYAIKS